MDLQLDVIRLLLAFQLAADIVLIELGLEFRLAHGFDEHRTIEFQRS